MFSKKKHGNIESANVNISKSKARHVAPTASLPTAVFSWTRAASCRTAECPPVHQRLRGPRPVTGPVKGWNWRHNYNVAFCIKTSNKQTLSTFLEKLHSFPAQSTGELAHPTVPKGNTHPALPSPKPRLNLDYLKWHWDHGIRWICKHQVILTQFPWNFMDKMSHPKLDYPKYSSIAGNWGWL